MSTLNKINTILSANVSKVNSWSWANVASVNGMIVESGTILGKISTGHYYSFYINTEGQVWGWGYNTHGELGNNAIVDKSTPVSILGTKKTFCSITGGMTHSHGIDVVGQIWCWGYNNVGQLGINSTTSKSTPISILGTKKTFCCIESGNQYSLGIDYTGQIWGWGYNYYGRLGINSTTNKSTPVSILGNKKTFCSIRGKYVHSIGIDYTGQVWGWGYNLHGRLGDNSTLDKSTPVSILGNKKTFCYIKLGLEHSSGIDYTGQVWTWGYNNIGQLGINSVSSKKTPISILGIKKTFCYIALGSFHSLGIDYKGQVWGWGYNNRGQLGDNSVVNQSTPISILGTKKTFCQIDGGYYYSLGIDYKGQLWNWGDNNVGQLGINSTTSKSTPVMISYL